MNALTKCPLIIVFNILMMVAVKTKPQLRTKSNIALACLSTTDLAVGLVLQPLDIACASSLLNSDIMFCTITDLFEIVTSICILASFHHSFGFDERRALYWVKHSFVYEIQVTEVRIIMASALVWATAIILFRHCLSFSQFTSVSLYTTKSVATKPKLLLINFLWKPWRRSFSRKGIESFLHDCYCTVSYFTVLYSIKKSLAVVLISFKGKNPTQYDGYSFVCFLFIASYEFVV